MKKTIFFLLTAVCMACTETNIANLGNEIVTVDDDGLSGAAVGANIVKTDVFSISIPDGYEYELDTIPDIPNSCGLTIKNDGRNCGIIYMPVGINPEKFPLSIFADSASYAVGEMMERTVGGKTFKSQLYDSGDKMLRVNLLSEGDDSFFILEEIEDGEQVAGIWDNLIFTETAQKSFQERLNKMLQILDAKVDGDEVIIEGDKLLFYMNVEDESNFNAAKFTAEKFVNLANYLTLFSDCAKMGYDFVIRAKTKNGELIFDKTFTAEEILQIH